MKSIILSLCFLLSMGFAHAQTKLTKENIQKDSIIKVEIIDPAITDAQGDAPNWSSLTTEITQKYDAVYADRTVTKAQIYYDYGKDWPVFSTAIVRYTEKYEDHNNLKLLNYNAGFILKYSTDKKELETAMGWSKHTVEKEPGNADYEKTYDALKAKTESK